MLKLSDLENYLQDKPNSQFFQVSMNTFTMLTQTKNLLNLRLQDVPQPCRTTNMH